MFISNASLYTAFLDASLAHNLLVVCLGSWSLFTYLPCCYNIHFSPLLNQVPQGYSDKSLNPCDYEPEIVAITLAPFSSLGFVKTR